MESSFRRIYSIFFVLAVISLCIPSSIIVFAATNSTVGVKAGDWAEYKVLPAPLYSMGSTNVGGVTKYRLDVLGVNGTSVTYRVAALFEQGSMSGMSGRFWVNSTSTVSLYAVGNSTQFIIPAGLTAGDAFTDPILGKINLSASPDVRDRAVVHASLSFREIFDPYGEYHEDIRMDCYWDRETGVLVEAHGSYYAYQLSETSLWKPSPIGYIVAAAILIVGSVILFKKRSLVKSLLRRLDEAIQRHYPMGGWPRHI